jgi:DNA-binding PadR family transcriptional regulator
MIEENLFKKQLRIRGMLDFWIIFLLKKKPMNGYEIMKTEKHTGYWKPTTGAVYPVLEKLKEKGIVKVSEDSSRKQKIYSLTEKGKQITGQMTDHIMKNFRESKFRRITESLIWPDEPESLKVKFDELSVSICDFRVSLKGKYKNAVAMRKVEGKLNKIIGELKK